jgi:hypothetical protein
MKPSDFMPEPGSEAFERCRKIVARKLRWKVANVMDWEVRSYILEQINDEASTTHFDPAPGRRT